MSSNSAVVVRNPRKGRSRFTNESRVMLFGDGRSTGARRLRDVRAALISELGCIDGLPESARQAISRAAQTSVECEILEALKASGEDVDPTIYATAYNANRRAMRDFAAIKAQLAVRAKPTLAQYLAESAARRAEVVT